MTVTDTVLVLFIVALLAYAIYDEFIMPRRHGETLLTLPLLRRGRIDAFIFAGLVVILIYNNVMVIMCAGINGDLPVLDPLAKTHF